MFFFVSIAILSVLVFLPIAMFIKNVSEFQRAPRDASLLAQAQSHRISVCIPARNEEKSIGRALAALMESSHPTLDVFVLDDHSEDQTASIVAEWQSRDARVHLIASKPLPSGWNGKQHACWQLAHHATGEWILFLDADVRLSHDALTRCAAQQIRSNAPLLSGFPKQETGTLAEKILIPMMHYVLLCYLPLDRMRKSVEPGFAAGCGQLFLASREEYFRVGGHSAISQSRHDGIQLPRAFRRHGLATDLFDATDIAVCRMYESTSQVQRGLLKNASEGIASAKLIFPFTILLAGATLAAPALLALAWVNNWSWASRCVLLTLTAVAWLPRLIAARRFEQSWIGALCHPIAIAWFLVLQWYAAFQKAVGLQVAWRGRSS